MLKNEEKKTSKLKKIGEWLQFTLFFIVLKLLSLLPYRTRVSTFGWLTEHLIGPIVGWRRRIKENFAYIFPSLPQTTVQLNSRKTENNIGRFLIEIFSPTDLRRQATLAVFKGPGLEHLREAQNRGKPVIIVSGHFGNYDMLRAGLIVRGFDTGALYRPMNNKKFNDIYERAIKKIGTPLFRRGRKGMTAMIKHLRSGKVLAVLIDQHMDHGIPLEFFDKPALTSTSSAEMALKYNSLLIPAYAIRQKNGIDFHVIFENPIVPSTPEAMTQQLNDSLEKRVREHMDQWLWTHRRWKMKQRIGSVND
ncbi:MAG: lysophospholipid acyltransferase family protein [Aestuariivita sp.]|nr:lysophospholipid acyltransferase family protein [Aestuariivita sp.]